MVWFFFYRKDIYIIFYSLKVQSHTNNIVPVNHRFTVVFCRSEGIDVRVVKRGEYDEEVVRWADAIISAGGEFPAVGHTHTPNFSPLGLLLLLRLHIDDRGVLERRPLCSVSEQTGLSLVRQRGQNIPWDKGSKTHTVTHTHKVTMQVL